MVIDIHTHAFPDKIASRAIAGLVESTRGVYPPCTDGTLGGLKDSMREFGVDISVLQPVVTKPTQTESLNLWARDAECENIISFGGVYPHSDTIEKDIDFVCSLGLKGIKLHPEYQQFTLNDPKMMRVYDYALSRGLAILFHAGYDPAYPPPIHSTPTMFREVVRSMRGGVIIAGHLGGRRQTSEVLDVLVGEDIYLDTSAGFDYYSVDEFLSVLRAHGSDKILFGSDAPWTRADKEIEAIRSLPISLEDIDNILYLNAKRILNI